MDAGRKFAFATKAGEKCSTEEGIPNNRRTFNCKDKMRSSYLKEGLLLCVDGDGKSDTDQKKTILKNKQIIIHICVCVCVCVCVYASIIDIYFVCNLWCKRVFRSNIHILYFENFVILHHLATNFQGKSLAL